jgi:hypothetical protein
MSTPAPAEKFSDRVAQQRASNRRCCVVPEGALAKARNELRRATLVARIARELDEAIGECPHDDETGRRIRDEVIATLQHRGLITDEWIVGWADMIRDIDGTMGVAR